MKEEMVMKLHLLRNCTLIGVLLAAATSMAGTSDKKITESVKAMEQSLGLTITTPSDLARNLRLTQQIPNSYISGAPGIAPDGTAIAWWSEPYPYRGEKIPFLTIDSLKE